MSDLPGKPASLWVETSPPTAYPPLEEDATVDVAVLGLDAVFEALVVDVPGEGAESWMPLFVVLRQGARLDEALTRELRRRVREECSPRHVPSDVIAVAEVPRTLSGKLLEVPVKRILMGTPPDRAASRDSLQNPAALDPFVALAAGAPRRGADAGFQPGPGGTAKP